MDQLLSGQLEIYREKLAAHSVKESWLQKNLPELHAHLSGFGGGSSAESLYLMGNDRPGCVSCGAPTRFLSYSRGYREFCSKACSNSDPAGCARRTESFRKAAIERWGVDNPMKAAEVAKKVSDSRAMLDKEAIAEKARKTTLERHGVDNVSKLDRVKAAKIATSRRNLGVDNPFQSEGIKARIREVALERYGVDHPMKSVSIRTKAAETNMARFGAANPMQSDAVKKKKRAGIAAGTVRTTLNSDPLFVAYHGDGRYTMRCDGGQGHDFEIDTHLYHARKGLGNGLCTRCNPVGSTPSVKEIQLRDFVSSVYRGEVIQGHRDGWELDIYLPGISVGIEYNGLYWHSERFKDRGYHLAKTEHFAERGIRVYHVWEDDWIHRNAIVRSQVGNWLGVTGERLMARDGEVRVVRDRALVRSFLESSHIQGYVRSSLAIGLFIKEELASLMTFDHSEGRMTMPADDWNLSRFCNRPGTVVAGAASRLITHFERLFSPRRVITFADREWSVGGLYDTLGFTRVHVTAPNYKYIVSGRRVNKQRYTKDRLIREGHDPALSEREITQSLGLARVWDCGQIKYQKEY